VRLCPAPPGRRRRSRDQVAFEPAALEPALLTSGSTRRRPRRRDHPHRAAGGRALDADGGSLTHPPEVGPKGRIWAQDRGNWPAIERHQSGRGLGAYACAFPLQSGFGRISVARSGCLWSRRSRVRVPSLTLKGNPRSQSRFAHSRHRAPAASVERPKWGYPQYRPQNPSREAAERSAE
jgi:hypothetical protein